MASSMLRPSFSAITSDACAATLESIRLDLQRKALVYSLLLRSRRGVAQRSACSWSLAFGIFVVLSVVVATFGGCRPLEPRREVTREDSIVPVRRS